MRISFDLDDTRICYQASVPREKSLLAWLAQEPLRLGAKALIRELQRSGHLVGIYTTSYRKPSAIRRWLFCFGLRPAFVLTQRDNEAHVADIHVLPEEPDWVERVREQLR